LANSNSAIKKLNIHVRPNIKKSLFDTPLVGLVNSLSGLVFFLQ